MNKADNLSEKSCNSLVFEDEAKVLTFACITTDNVNCLLYTSPSPRDA